MPGTDCRECRRDAFVSKSAVRFRKLSSWFLFSFLPWAAGRVSPASAVLRPVAAASARPPGTAAPRVPGQAGS